MGYTHYFYQNGITEKDTWILIISGIQEAYKLLPLEVKADIQDLDINPEEIYFNGSCETLYIPRVPELELNFCKTNARAYDLFVVCCLVLCWHYAPENFKIRSDGEIQDFEAGIELASRAIGSNIEFRFS